MLLNHGASHLPNKTATVGRAELSGDMARIVGLNRAGWLSCPPRLNVPDKNQQPTKRGGWTQENAGATKNPPRKSEGDDHVRPE